MPTFAGPLASPGYWLHHAALRWRAQLETELRPLGLTTTQFIMLASIGWLEHEGLRPSQQQAADVAGSDRMMASRVVRSLEGAGLVRRTPDAQDARTVRLALTTQGQTTGNRAASLARAVDRGVFGELRDTWASALRELGHSSDQ